uniref:Uncharacterized protein n=1 Tax=Anguilla anguilla TaxID=7936 RepID=A0A0E9RTM1_ANGAN
MLAIELPADSKLARNLSHTKHLSKVANVIHSVTSTS